MKYLFIALFSVSLTASAQKNQDSLAMVFAKENQHFADSLQSRVVLKQYRDWMYENVSAKVYGEFMLWYNEYLKARVIEWRGKKK